MKSHIGQKFQNFTNNNMKPDYSARKYGLPTMPTKERLMSMAKVNPITNCWEWQGCKNLGYGHTIIGSRKDGTRHTIRAHRLSYLLWKGEIPDGYCVCHKCDNPSCINPEHLFIGTKKDNADDRDIKGRNSHTKLTKKIVKEIRYERAYKGTKYIELAQRYGISELSIIKAIKGKTWKCVDYYPQLPSLKGGE